jgi:hypothetical protein
MVSRKAGKTQPIEWIKDMYGQDSANIGWTERLARIPPIGRTDGKDDH